MRVCDLCESKDTVGIYKLDFNPTNVVPVSSWPNIVRNCELCKECARQVEYALEKALYKKVSI